MKVTIKDTAKVFKTKKQKKKVEQEILNILKGVY